MINKIYQLLYNLPSCSCIVPIHPLQNLYFHSTDSQQCDLFSEERFFWKIGRYLVVPPTNHLKIKNVLWKWLFVLWSLWHDPVVSFCPQCSGYNCELTSPANLPELWAPTWAPSGRLHDLVSSVLLHSSSESMRPIPLLREYDSLIYRWTCSLQVSAKHYVF